MRAGQGQRNPLLHPSPTHPRRDGAVDVLEVSKEPVVLLRASIVEVAKARNHDELQRTHASDEGMLQGSASSEHVHG